MNKMLRIAILAALSPRGSEANQLGLKLVPEGAASQETLTFTGQPTDGETVTIAGQVYTFQASPAAIGDIDIGAAVGDSINNLVDAINNRGNEGTDYFTGTPQNAQCWATRGAGDTLIAYSRRFNATTGDAIAVATDVTLASWGNATLQNGVSLGTTPTDSVDWLTLCYTSETLAANINYDRSERICAGAAGGASRMLRKRTTASQEPGGQVNGEVMYSPIFHELLRGAMNGNWIPNIQTAGEDVLAVDISQQSYTIEKTYNEFTNRFEVWTGMVVGQLTINIPWGRKATYTATFLGRTHDATLSTTRVGSGTVTGEPDNEIMAGARDFANLQFDDAAIPDLVVQEIIIDINNNARGVNGLGNLGPSEHRFGDATITGTLRMYGSDGAFGLFLDALANTDKKLDFDMTDPAGNTYHFEFPVINITGDPLSSPGRNQDVFFSAPFEAHSEVCFITRDDA